MWRIILSIIFGIIFPLACVAMLAFTEKYIPSALMLSSFHGKPAPGILLAPFLLPVYFDIFVKEERILPLIFDTFWFRVISVVLFDWLLYGTIIYFILGRFKRFKKKSVEVSSEPPPPPLF